MLSALEASGISGQRLSELAGYSSNSVTHLRTSRHIPNLIKVNHLLHAAGYELKVVKKCDD